MRSRLLQLACTIALACASQAAWAECYGFTDTNVTVDSCNAIEWLKNRSITLGCGGTNFCPDDPVKREHMALFMQRLGKALTPVVLHKEQLFPDFLVEGTPKRVCESADYTVGTGSFPRLARFSGSVWGHPNAGDSWLHGWWVYTSDGNTWSTVGNWQVDQFGGRDWASYAQVAGFAVLAPPLALTPGVTYRFAIAVNSAGSGSYPFHPLVCQMEVTIQNANPATSPLDE